ncbi:MAG: UvrB/UvrC motif-containing protein, partial [Oscillospiraceae bacterium]|nr:UvrB/UvrC motif-containing protein [Oscillospiraceae bacterium]
GSSAHGKKGRKWLPKAEREKLIAQYTAEMKKAAKLLDFEHAAFLRDKIKELQDN